LLLPFLLYFKKIIKMLRRINFFISAHVIISLIHLLLSFPNMQNINELWEQFKIDEKKNYSTKLENQKRFEIWKDNFNYVLSHNKLASTGQESFFLEMNSYCDMVFIIFYTMQKKFKTIHIFFSEI
jgi:hypothetical protein